ncbi:hypothetical protein RhiirA4_453328 [Rhizophagus irregularis]|uniref:Uncharacterized protein n=1 Tax=Rhizophagus irregularis TaxID=588596 RepID=A0A2I1G060_9GLOM|nr:hypothetical protein RhiirA4_453328 [Rhizophagus irregularis]
MVFAENKPSTEPFSFFSQLSGSIAKPNLSFRKQNLKKESTNSANIKIIVGVCSSSYPINCTYNYNVEFYLDGIELDDKYYPSRKSPIRQSLPMSEQTMVVYYSITISKDIVDNYAYGLAGGELARLYQMLVDSLVLYLDSLGFLQTHVFNCLCTRYKRRLIKKLQTKYEPIPFISGRTRNVTLEERVQNIENILKEYYLDTSFLNSLIEDNKVDDKV